MRRPINTVNGYYKDPGKHWSAQDALNVLVRMAEKSGTRTVSRLVDAPGLRPFCRIGTNAGGEVGFTPSGAGRGMRVVDGRLFVVAGRTLWQITADGVSVPYGTIPGVGRVSMAHTQRGNGFELSIDNNQSRYVFNTLTQDLQKVTDESFSGSMRAFAIDGYTGYLEPQGLYWGHSDLADALNYIAFDTYEAEGQPDRIVSATVDNNRQVLIIGQQTTEIYVNQGSAQAPFVRASNTIIPYGSAARDSVQNFGSGTVLLDQNRVVRILSTGDDRISTSVIDSALQECTRQQIANAYSFTLEGDGFQIYYLTVPGKFTFGFDFVNREWHRRSSTDLDWWAVADVVQWNGKWYALDSRFGEIFEVRWRDYPFDGQKELVREWVTGSVSADQNPVYVHELELLFGCGGQDFEIVNFPPQPIGPSIGGDAPDPLSGDPYSFSYTTTPSDSPIARTVLLTGSYAMLDGELVTLTEAGLQWNQSTATISSANALPNLVVSLKMRVYDENGLYADHEDMFVVVTQVTLLVSGSPLGGGQPVIAQAQTYGAFSFTGIPTSSGADTLGYFPAYYKKPDEPGVWMLGGSDEYLYGANVTSWTPGVMPFTDGNMTRRMAGGPDGWLASTIQITPAQFGKMAATPDPFVLSTITIVRPDNPVSLPTISNLGMIRVIGNRYYADPRNLTGYLITTEDISDPEWLLLHGRGDSAPPNEDIGVFYDICEFDGALYATVLKSVTNPRYQLRRSTDGGVSWEDPILDGDGTDPVPWQLEAGNGVLLVYCWGGTHVYTSANNFSTPILTGIQTTTTVTAEQEPRGRQIVFTGSYFYLISGAFGDPAKANKCVRTLNGLEISAPVSIPLNSVVGIATDWVQENE